MQRVSNLPVPSNGEPIYRFWASRPCEPTGWLALLLTKAGDVETNPCPTTSNKRVWICDICYKQIHVRKQISIRCNRIEHWVHLRCTGIRQAQYTDTPALDTIPEPRVRPTCPAPTTLNPSPTPALPSTSHHHTLSSDTHATQTNSTRITVTATTSST